MCHATLQEFAERFCNSASLLGSDLFAYGPADDERVQQEYRTTLMKKLDRQTCMLANMTHLDSQLDCV